jgi:hypothetical protein
MKFKVKDLKIAITEVSTNSEQQQQQLEQVFDQKNENPKKPFLYFLRNICKILSDRQKHSFIKTHTKYSDLNLWLNIEQMLQLTEDEQQEVDQVYSNVVSRGASFEWFIDGLYESSLNSQHKIIIADQYHEILQNQKKTSQTKRKFSPQSSVSGNNDGTNKELTDEKISVSKQSDDDLPTECYDGQDPIRLVTVYSNLTDSEKIEDEDEVIKDEEEFDEKMTSDSEGVFCHPLQDKVFLYPSDIKKDFPLTTSAKAYLINDFNFSDSESESDVELKQLKQRIFLEEQKQETIKKLRQEKSARKRSIEEMIKNATQEIEFAKKTKRQEEKKKLLSQQLSEARKQTTFAQQELNTLEQEVKVKEDELKELETLKNQFSFN